MTALLLVELAVIVLAVTVLLQGLAIRNLNEAVMKLIEALRQHARHRPSSSSSRGSRSGS